MYNNKIIKMNKIKAISFKHDILRRSTKDLKVKF